MMEKLMLRRWRCCGLSGVKNGLKQAQEFLDQLQRPSTVWMSNWQPFKGATRLSTRWEGLDFRLQEVITRALYKGHCASDDKSRVVTRTAALLCVAVRRSSEWRRLCPKTKKHQSQLSDHSRVPWYAEGYCQKGLVFPSVIRTLLLLLRQFS